MTGKRVFLPLLTVIWALSVISAFASTCSTNTTALDAKICAPSSNSNTTTTFHFSGATSSTNGVKVSQIYIDGVKKADYFVPDIEVSLTLPVGTHHVTLQAIDNKNLITKASEYINVHDSQVTLSWKPSTSTGVDSYIVYRSTRSGSGYSEAGSTAGTSFVDHPGLGTFFYVVSSVTPKGESGYSSQVAVTLK